MPESRAPRRLAAIALPLLIWLMVSGVVLHRIEAEPMQPYGSGSAHYIEHVARLDVVRALRAGPDTPLGEVLDTIDDEFPPLMHVVTAGASALFGLEVRGVLWTSLLWLALLATCVGWTARALTHRPGAGAAAASALLLTPAFHGFATRYYYDLPMTALLWLTVAVAVSIWPRHRWTGTLLVGLCSLAVGLVKWAALAFGPGLVLGAALSHRGTPRLKRVAWALLAGLLFLGLLWGTSKGLGPQNSLGAVTGEIITDWNHDPNPAPALASAEAMSRWGDFFARHANPSRAIFYAGRTVGSIFGLWGFGLLLWCLVPWWRDGRSGLPLLLATGLAHGFFLLFVMPVVDDRFLLPLVPVLIVLAAIGWSAWPKRRRRGVGAAAVLVGAAVLLDLHVGGPDWMATVVVEVPGEPERRVPSSPIRLLGLDDSVEQRGWTHRARQPDEQEALRERIWTDIAACGADALRIDEETPLAWAFGDWYWLQYRARLDELRGVSGPVEIREPCSGHVGEEVDLGITVSLPGRPDTHRCFPASEWARVGSTELDDRAVVYWGRVHQNVCGQQGPAASAQPCAQPGTCEDGYRAFLRRAGPGPEPLNEGALRRLNDRFAGPDPVVEAPDPDVPATIRRALAIDEPLAALAAPPVEVEGAEDWPGGRVERLVIDDPWVGRFSAVFLRPDGSGPHPAVVVHPGHRERAEWHVDNRFGASFPHNGVAILVIEPRMHDATEPVAALTADLLAAGRSLLGLRAYEVMAALEWLRAREDIDPARLGVAGHSGGSAVVNLVWRLDPSLAALATDMESQYWSREPGGWADDTAPLLAAITGQIGDRSGSRPVLRAPYGYPEGPRSVVRFFTGAFGLDEPARSARSCWSREGCASAYLGAVDRLAERRGARRDDLEADVAEALGLGGLSSALLRRGSELVEMQGDGDAPRDSQVVDPIVGVVPGTVWVPEGAGPLLGVVVRPGPGDEAWARSHAERLREAGYAVLVLHPRAHGEGEAALRKQVNEGGVSLLGLRAWELVSAGRAFLGHPSLDRPMLSPLGLVARCYGADVGLLAGELDAELFGAMVADQRGCPDEPSGRGEPGTEAFWEGIDSGLGEPFAVHRPAPDEDPARPADFLRDQLMVAAGIR